MYTTLTSAKPPIGDAETRLLQGTSTNDIAVTLRHEEEGDGNGYELIEVSNVFHSHVSPVPLPGIYTLPGVSEAPAVDALMFLPQAPIVETSRQEGAGDSNIYMISFSNHREIFLFAWRLVSSLTILLLNTPRWWP